MFSTTLSMWLGITFLALAVVAVLLQAWLWGPRFWDQDNRRTKAPRGWLRVHALCGYAYGLIYLFMMWNMLPRLWEYQYELPARTVIHAVVAITIGVLLVSKLAILRFFRHFEEAMPRLGFGLLLCTVLLISLSVPYALRAHDFSGRTTAPENLERVKRLLADVDLGEGVDLDELASARGLDRGRTVLVTKCTACHDMRTVLLEPRTANKWHEVNLRMLDKPAVFGERLQAEDLPWVTAYLVAITPDIQESVKRRRGVEQAEQRNATAVGEAVHLADEFVAPALDDAAAQALLQDKCTQCHELDDVRAHGGDDVAGWRSVVAAMVEEGAEVSDEQAAQLAAYLARTQPAEGSGPPVPAAPAPEPAPEPAPAAPEEAAPPEPTPAKAVKKTRPKQPNPPEEGAETAAAPEPQPEPSKPRGSVAAGQGLFLKKCKSCHGEDGKGQSAYGQKIGVPDLTGSSMGASAIRKVIADGRSGTKMRGYASSLSEQELEDLVQFVRSL